MYNYSEFDRDFVKNRVAQFREQVERRISGALTEDEFKPLRLMNGLYLQLHAYMLRVAIPYGTLNSSQMDTLADIADEFDKGYGHFTTRQNIQYNWPQLRDVPDILDRLADVGMHAIQTSGNTIRNVTADAYAGAAQDEVADPRPVAELIRQWSTDHPEFQFLPRKFKIAVTGSEQDRAVIKAHDIGLKLVKQGGQLGAEVVIGGGLGRTPMIGQVIDPFVPMDDLLAYLEAVVSVYNVLGRRDNKYKARIKITVFENGIEKIRELVNARFEQGRNEFTGPDQNLLKAITKQFALPEKIDAGTSAFDARLLMAPDFAAWVQNVTYAHKLDAYAIVNVSIKKHGQTPGDATSDQMRVLADVARKYGHDELRISHTQNVVIPHVHKSYLPAVYAELQKADLATDNIGKISDIIACPGMDYCSLATARSIPVAQKIATHFQEIGLENEIGELKIKISGCINACGHHHVGHVGILGLDRAGVENYQITLGGSEAADAKIGERAGPGFSYTEIVPAIERLLRAYLAARLDAQETFLSTYERIGADVFKAALYPAESKAA